MIMFLILVWLKFKGCNKEFLFDSFSWDDFSANETLDVIRIGLFLGSAVVFLLLLLTIKESFYKIFGKYL